MAYRFPQLPKFAQLFQLRQLFQLSQLDHAFAQLLPHWASRTWARGSFWVAFASVRSFSLRASWTATARSTTGLRLVTAPCTFPLIRRPPTTRAADVI